MHLGEDKSDHQSSVYVCFTVQKYKRFRNTVIRSHAPVRVRSVNIVAAYAKRRHPQQTYQEPCKSLSVQILYFKHRATSKTRPFTVLRKVSLLCHAFVANLEILQLMLKPGTSPWSHVLFVTNPSRSPRSTGT
jgi:hypothetical protein